MIKKYLLLLLVSITFTFYGVVNAEVTIETKNKNIMEALMGLSGEDILINDNDVNASSEEGLGALAQIFIWVKNTISELLLFIAVAVFLYIGIKLAVARGDPEEFKKAMVHFIYAVIGIFLVSIAWAVVTLVSGIKF